MTRRPCILIAVLALAVLGFGCGDEEGLDPSDPSVLTEADQDDSETTDPTDPEGEIPPLSEIDPDDHDARLEAARALWDAADIDDYDMTYHQVCFCMNLEVTVRVRDGEVEDFVVGEGELDDEDGALTMDDLFDDVERALDGDAQFVDVSYSEATGQILDYFIDYDEDMVDEEFGITVDSLEPGVVDEPLEGPSAIDPERLVVDDYGCGYGFHLGDSDQTVALHLDFSGSDPAAIPAVVELPNSAWSAEVHLGSDLFANWCSDVIEEPESEVEETWDVVGGAIVFDHPETRLGSCDGVEVSATIEGLVVRAPDGEEIPLGDFDLVNRSWGCFAG